VVIPTAFSSGHLGTSRVNTTKVQKVVRLNLTDYRVGERFYTYTLTGTDGEDFSRKVFINGTGGILVAGGPEEYESIEARATLIGDEIRILMPPLSAVYLLVEPGTKTLPVNNEVTAVEAPRAEENIVVYPNPSTGSFTAANLTDNISRIEISDSRGTVVYRRETEPGAGEITLNTGLHRGVWLISFHSGDYVVTRKLIIK